MLSSNVIVNRESILVHGQCKTHQRARHIDGFRKFRKIVSFFIAYSIQAFANINVIQITPMYFIIMGLILSYEEVNTIKNVSDTADVPIKYIL